MRKKLILLKIIILEKKRDKDKNPEPSLSSLRTFVPILNVGVFYKKRIWNCKTNGTKYLYVIK